MKLYCPTIWRDGGWQSGRILEVDDEGVIQQCDVGGQEQGDTVLQGPVLPGMPNLHSHAFQRLIAGQTGAVSLTGGDSFWSWRKAMYQWAGRLDPEQIQVITGFCYMELLKGGYTSVAEFHYLHKDAQGNDYSNPGETSEAVIRAAHQTGMGLTLLPVLYARSGFGTAGVLPQQRPFHHSVDSYLNLVQKLNANVGEDMVLGVAPHSLRAVSGEDLSRLLDGLNSVGFSGPVHIHISEQQQEVEDCLAFHRRAPVQWLLDEYPVDRRWCLVHATHTNEAERGQIAHSGAAVGLCPTTEADLGDGLFPVAEFMQQGGHWGIGSDSNLRCNAVEELRLLEWGQRLVKQERNILHGGQSRLGAGLYNHALSGGAQALAQPVGRLDPGCRADFLVLNPEASALQSADLESVLDSYIFANREAQLHQVWCKGKLVVEKNRHIHQDAIEWAYRQVLGTS